MNRTNGNENGNRERCDFEQIRTASAASNPEQPVKGNSTVQLLLLALAGLLLLLLLPPPPPPQKHGSVSGGRAAAPLYRRPGDFS